LRRSRHAKIVATAGPASAEPEKIRALYLSGVDIFRLNFSHGTHEDHAKSYVCIRELEREFGRQIGILQDLQSSASDPLKKAGWFCVLEKRSAL